MLALMGDILKLIWWAVIGLFRSRTSLEAEILTLRHQLNVLRRKAPKRLAFSNFDRLVFTSLYRIAPGVLDGTVTLPNRARNKSAGMLGSRRSDDVAPRLHRRGPEGSVRFCGGEMALDVESVVSGCVG